MPSKGHFLYQTNYYISGVHTVNTLDFTVLNESLQNMIGNVTKSILKAMYGVDFRFDVDLANLPNLMKEQEQLNFTIRGEKSKVKSYVKAVARMKFYLDAMMDYGKEHPMTIKRKEELDLAVGDFEQETGARWPFKHEG